MPGRRVLCVIDNLGSGGAQRQLASLASGMVKLGHRTAVFTYAKHEGHFDAELRTAGIDILNYPRALGHPVVTAIKLRHLVRRGNYDVVISFMPAPSLVACMALSGLRDVRLIASERSSFPTGVPTSFDRLTRLLHRRADWITTNSYHQANLMRRHFPLLAGRLRTIYNGYDATGFRERGKRQSESVIRLVAVGRITRGKNIENLVQAVRSIREQGTDVRLDWIGRLDSVQWASGYHQRLSALIDETGLGAAWRWLGERSDVPARLAEYDALIHPSFYEGLPNAVCEAFAAGLPVLASEVCDHPQLIDPPRRGLLFQPDDVGSITDAIARFIRLDADQREAMGMAAREYALQELSLEKMCSAYSALL